MATIKPFRALRPREDLAEKIAALPYDVYSREEARKVVENNPYSFLKIDRAETQLREGIDLYSEEVYRCAADTLNGMIERGEFLREEKPCFYIYELTMNGRIQTGIGACASVRDYERQVIRKHENTRQEKEDDRTRHVAACGAQTGPIFLAYRYDEQIALLQKEAKAKPAVYDFTSEDGIRHRLWVIRDEQVIRQLENLFKHIPVMYIADGHHRAASAVRVTEQMRKEQMRKGQMRREEQQEEQEPGKAVQLPEYEYFLSVIFADRDLLVMDYNRWVKDLNSMQEKEFLEKLRKEFCITLLEGRAHPGEKGQFTMYLNHRWYLLEEMDIPERNDPIASLDVSVLQNHVLRPFLGIENPKTDHRISFIGGIRGLQALEELVDQEGGVAFAMYPTSMGELFAVADEGKLMPPKSTWFEPKLRSGLLIHSI